MRHPLTFETCLLIPSTSERLRPSACRRYVYSLHEWSAFSTTCYNPSRSSQLSPVVMNQTCMPVYWWLYPQLFSARGCLLVYPSFLRRCYSYRSLQRLIIVNYRSTSQCGPAEPGVFLFDLIPPRVALCLFSSASWYLASGSSSYLREPNVAPLSSS